MKLKDIGEFGFIEKISQGCLIRPDNIIQAIGDDAAAFYTDAGLVSLVTTDLLVERVHFLRDATTGFNLGYKSLAVNLSDIAAMASTVKILPRKFFTIFLLKCNWNHPSGFHGLNPWLDYF